MLTQLNNDIYYSVGSISSNTTVAAFDLDNTVVRTIKGQFPKDEHDWKFLPNRLSTLLAWQNNATIVIFTNQGYKGVKLTTALNRINNILTILRNNGITPWCFVATGPNSPYRKPSNNMWNLFKQHVTSIDMKGSFYCGDAGGRSADHSADDSEFATVVGLPFYTPEQIFPRTEVTIPNTQTMFIFVGMPGAGKSTFYQQQLAARGYILAQQDLLKTPAKVKAVVQQALANGQSVAVDGTNPSVEKRRELLDLAVQYHVPTMILYFVTDGHGRNKLRTNPVPTIAYSMYYKNLVEPSEATDGVPVVEIE